MTPLEATDIERRVRAVAEGGTINGTYEMMPMNALQAFRGDLLALLDTATRVKVLEEALEPFATFADTFIDEEGWSGPMRSECIVDWFGPSDFRRARTALTASEDDRG